MTDTDRDADVNQTAGDGAREWARAHSDFSGRLLVLSSLPKGKGGRKGFATARTLYFVREGRAVMLRCKRLPEPSPEPRFVGPHWNGECYVCGRIFLDPVLQRAWSADPEAGRPVPSNELSGVEAETPHVYAEEGYTHACLDCIRTHGLTVRPGDRAHVYHNAGKILVAGPGVGSQPRGGGLPHLFVRRHPRYARRENAAPERRLDLREGSPRDARGEAAVEMAA